MKKELYIVDGIRTPFCKMGTSLAEMTAVDLGVASVKDLLARVGIEGDIIDEVIFGCVSQPADAANIARVIAVRAGLPTEIPAVTVHRNCASGIEAITQAYEKMSAGQGEVFLVGGSESMSRIPFLYKNKTVGKFAKVFRSRSLGQRISSMLNFRPADFAPRIGLKLGLSDPLCGLNMGQTAELVARDFDISRDEQDEYSMYSHLKAVDAKERLAEEILPVYPGKGYVDCDNGPREGQSMKALGKLKTVFQRRDGTVTAGNASQVTDGSVAMLLASGEACEKYGLNPIGKVLCYGYAGCDPSRMGLGPVFAINKTIQKFGMKLKSASVVELNEAFAAQVMAVRRALMSKSFCRKFLNKNEALGEIEAERINVNGGAIALGHPVGASGARLVLTALKELKRRKEKIGLASLCVGGGQGAAIWLEAV